MRDFHNPGRSEVFAANGMCASSHPFASMTAIEILKAGGNAVDAAISGALILGICEPHMTGIGGDCFVLVKPASQDHIVALNGSGRSPKALDPNNLRDAHDGVMPEKHPDAITLPGAVDAFCKLSEDYGRLDLAEVLKPAIDAAENGVPVAPRVAFDWATSNTKFRGGASAIFLKDGKPLATGDTFRAPGQAEVLRKIAAKGREGFYSGEVAEDMVASLQAAGGTHELADFAATRSTYGDAVSGEYKGVELLEHPPNGQGATAILLNNILAEFDLASMEPFGAMRAHIEAEAAKLAMDARNRFIADPDFVTRLEYMLDPATGKKLAGLIELDRAMPDAQKASEAVHKETVYITVIDRDLMAVSLIYSIYDDFGSGFASDKFGILFHNRGAGFNLIPGHPNEAGGSKRPMHTIIPAMVAKNGRLNLSYGVMGGAYQPTGHSRVLTNILDFGLGLQTSLDAPRCFATDGILKMERGYSEQVCRELSDLGHKIEIPEKPLGGAQAIRIDYEKGVLEGASDPRKDGCALGY